ncbi:hypothetical protein C4D60_Mb10t27650 [Musa balbisiana]|uniref:Dof zinc finger protein n=1 Tax=Musa balbisiana TaxID=52838 RepID=A0A4V4H550_MUSBA|nr:hypothetical protein C4D60_Mb10t27650 [Musa balbisiana]
MVLPSVPVYVDPPNWNQLHAPQLGSSTGGGRNEAPQLPPPPPPPGLVGTPRGEGGMVGSIRPGSMAERARLAKIGQPEQALRCPRCDSTNTKFCYFNNYSLSQPRHFCKACRRYWTRGGALRNVPVGGGCRRNKRTKSGSSGSAKNAVTTAYRQSRSPSSTIAAGATTSGITLQQQQRSPLMSSLYPPPDCRTRNLGFGFDGIQSFDAVEYQVPGSHSVGLENLRLHQHIRQFPSIMGGLEPPPSPPPRTPSLTPFPSLYPSFIGEGSGSDGRSLAALVPTRVPSSGLLMQLASTKMDDNAQELGLPRHDLIWGGSAGGSSNGGWATATGFSSFSSSLTDKFL